MEKNDNYFLGIDAGSDSVGWAATDSNYNLIRLKGKTAWGARIFEEGKDAKTRRLFRTGGRRLERRKHRLVLLQGMFEREIDNIDNTFFLRLNESQYLLEDKSESARFICPLFKTNDKEKEFYKEYPTIWHLRKALISNDSKAFSDIRYVYLAIHHIMKYRGNFLKDGDIDPQKFNFDIFASINNVFRQIIADDQGIELSEVDFELINNENGKLIIDVLSNKNLYKNSQKKEIKTLLSLCGYDENVANYIDLFITLIVGGSYDSTKLFPNEEKINIEFNSSYDDKIPLLEQLFGEYYSIIENAKSIFDFIYVKKLLGNSNLLSFAYIDVYEQHKKQLKELKTVLIEVDKKRNLQGAERTYYKMFHSSKEKSNYCYLARSDEFADKRVSVADFNKYAREVLTKNEEYISNKEVFSSLMDLANKNSLLECISNVSNSTIPHQLHYNELLIILSNAQKHFPFIGQIAEKIIKLFLFRVPYYYGPIDTRSPYSNVVLKEIKREPITPWNIDEQIDNDKTRIKFMNSLTNKCSYLITENVLPKESIIFSDYEILNKLNTIRVDGTLITHSLKLELFEFISNRQKTTIEQIKKFLLDHHKDVFNNGNIAISGLNETDFFTSKARSIFGKVFNLSTIDSEDFGMVENIIFLLTVYTDNKNDAIKVILNNYKLNKEQLIAVKSINCAGWSPLSKKLLVGIKAYDQDGVVSSRSIYSILLETEQNFMQIVNNSEYSFNTIIENAKKSAFNNLSKKEIIDLYISNTPPLMHRTIIQTLRIVDEVKSITRKDPQKIAIEVTRNNKAKKDVPLSRLDELNKFLKTFKKDFDYYTESCFVKEELDNIVKTKNIFQLKGKHLYLYFKQLGLDMYTGEKINIDDVLSGNNYDIDHIIPQSLIKNDSLDNTVLTKREINQKVKIDIYPLPTAIRYNPKVLSLWKCLKEHKEISDTKYNALIRSEDITESELAEFVNRQINVVDHSNIVVKDILSELYKNTTIIFSKAQYPTYIRQEYEIPKIRDLNDGHHAVDAYLNIVAGTILNDVYGDMRRIKARIASENNGDPTYYKDSFNMEHTIDRMIKTRDLLNKIKVTCNRHDFLLTYRNSYQDDAFYNQTINKKDQSSALIPVHNKNGSPLNDTTKYGGYIGLIPEYMIVATIKNKKGKTNRILVSVPRNLSILAKNNEEISKKLCKEFGENEVRFDFSRKIYPNQKVKINGCEYLLCTWNQLQVSLKPVTPIFISDGKYLSIIARNFLKLKENTDDKYEFYTDKLQKNKIAISKEQNLNLFKEIISLSFSKKYDYCPMISNIRLGMNEEYVSLFNLCSLYQQVAIILDLIKLYGRKSSTIINIKTPSTFLKSKNVLLKEHIFLIDESVTGLFSKVTEL